MSKRKPLKTSSYYTDSNFNIVKLTESQVKRIAKDAVKRMNRELLKVNSKIKGRYRFVGVKDCDTHWNYSIQYW